MIVIIEHDYKTLKERVVETIKITNSYVNYEEITEYCVSLDNEKCYHTWERI